MFEKNFIKIFLLLVTFMMNITDVIYTQDFIQFGKSTIKDSLDYQVLNKSLKVNGNEYVRDKFSVGTMINSNRVTEISSSLENQLRLTFDDGQNTGYTDFTVDDAGALSINSSYDNIYFGVPGSTYDNIHAGAYLLGLSTTLDNKTVLPNNVKKDSSNTFKDGSRFVFDGTMGDFIFNMEGGVSGRDFDFMFDGNSSFRIEEGGYVNAVTGYKLNGNDINESGALSNVGYLAQSQSWNGENTFSGGAILNGGLKVKRTEITQSSHDIIPAEIYLGCRTSMTSIVLTLPSAADNEGRMYIIKDEDGNASVNNITIYASGLDRIDGASSIILNRDYDKYAIISNGTGWCQIIK
jgi:hypothetical protein